MKYPTAALCFCLASPAMALERPHPAVPLDKGGDPHVVSAPYNPADTVLLVGIVSRSSTITFGKDEHIVRVMLEMGHNGPDGKSIPPPWEGPDPAQVSAQPLGNVLPLWATRAGRSSAQVITKTATGQQRIYQFMLVALPEQTTTPCDPTASQVIADCDDPRFMAGLSFSYAGEEKAAAVAEAAAVRKAAGAQTAKDRLRDDIFYGPRNWNYVGKGSRASYADLAPAQVSDNSEATGFKFVGRRRQPSIYVVDGDSERLVRSEPDQDMAVVHETAAHWRLRDGPYVFDVYNKAYNPDGVNPWTGTTSPEVVRVVKKAAR